MASVTILPSNRGQRNSVYKRFVGWGNKGVSVKMRAQFASDSDMERSMIDGTIVRAHACAAGAPQYHLETAHDQVLGRSKGGFTTKIHVIADAPGYPLDFILTGGQAAEITQSYVLIDGIQATYALIDKCVLFTVNLTLWSHARVQ